MWVGNATIIGKRKKFAKVWWEISRKKIHVWYEWALFLGGEQPGSYRAF